MNTPKFSLSAVIAIVAVFMCLVLSIMLLGRSKSNSTMDRGISNSETNSTANNPTNSNTVADSSQSQQEQDQRAQQLAAQEHAAEVASMQSAVSSMNSAENALDNRSTDNMTFDDYDSAFSGVLSAERSTDVSGCPDDFRNAYTDHVSDWEKLISDFESYKQFSDSTQSGEALLQDMISGANGDYSPEQNQLSEDAQRKQELQDDVNAVKASRQKVLDLASANGASS